VRDVAGLLGLVMIGAGLWWRAPWLALVVVGGLLVAGAVFGVLRNDNRPPDRP
jgi:hypothetical protein